MICKQRAVWKKAQVHKINILYVLQVLLQQPGKLVSASEFLLERVTSIQFKNLTEKW